MEKRRRSDNGRFNDVALTPAGQAALAVADKTWVRLVDARLHDWSATDKRDFLRLLQRYNESA
ncbi:MAG: hypothetical protein SPK16_03400 [Corynebacterium sp.]|nr:hypothetical protein [Corynebacterium sp.]